MNKIGKVEWSKYFKKDSEKLQNIIRTFGANKIYAMGLMPVRGSKGFRKLDYEFAEHSLNINKIMNRLEESHFNTVGVVIKDTDGACTWDTRIGWNPMKRDILGEFCDAGKDRNIKVIVSFTSMNDAYQGNVHPERVSVHGKDGEKYGKVYFKGEISTHLEVEMRIDLPQGVSFKEYQRKIPFLTDKVDKIVGKSRGARGKGLIPSTSFMCPNSAHVDYLLALAKEVIKNYPIKGFFADYIRYDGAFRDLCTCDRCISKFRLNFGEKAKLLRSKEWYDFKSESIAEYGKKLHNMIKSSNSNCISGWFCLPGPKKRFSRKRLGQDWLKLSRSLDVSSPMEYPYLMGTKDDGWYWGKVGDFFYWYFTRNMKKRAYEFNSPVLAIINSTECNEKEMLRQMRRFNFGLGIAVFKYFGTSETQWRVLKKYAEKEIGLENLRFN
jgi:hypothetical protein